MPNDNPIQDQERHEALLQALDPRLDISFPARLRLLEKYRGGYADHAMLAADELLLRRSVGLTRELLKVHADLKEKIEMMTAPPHFPSVFLRRVGAHRAFVALGGVERVVNIEKEDNYAPGDQVLLNGDRAFVIGKWDHPSALGDVASFEQPAGNGRLVVNHRGTSLVVQPVNGLVPEALRKGDLVLIDATNHLAIEQVCEPAGGRLPFEVEEEITAGVDDVGGLKKELDTLLWELLAGIEHRDIARRYRIDGFTSILLHGPPGTGKTLLARVAAGELQRRTGNRTRFIVVRPSEWRNEYVGVTEHIRETFAAIRKLAAEGGNIVIFLDEVDGFGRIRGAWRGTTVLDDFTNALLAELDGFKSLRNVAVISASNRHDLLDPALRERLAAVNIPIPRPRMEAARAIFRVHLLAEDPWLDAETREEAVECAVSLLYAPAGEDNDIARIRFNDGANRVVKACELCSGRLIQQIAKNARGKSAKSHILGHGTGITVDAVTTATEEVIDSLRTTLSRDNAASYLADLPQDLTVVAVEPVWPQSRRNLLSR